MASVARDPERSADATGRGSELPHSDERAEWLISVVAVLASCTYSAVHVHFDPLPNPDAVQYLLAAQAWLDGGYAAAAATYLLPFYPMLIGMVSWVTGAPVLTSAHWLDAALIALLIVALQRLVAALGGGARVQLIAVAFAVLLPELNGYRSFVLRDFGYWAFAMLAVVSLVGYASRPDPVRGAAFLVLCSVAAAFRLEAIPLLVLLPLGLLFGPARRLGGAGALYAAMLAAIAAGAVFAGRAVPSGWQLGTAMLVELPTRALARVEAFGTVVLDPQFHDYAMFGFAGSVLALIAVHLAIAASLPLSALGVAGALRRVGGVPNHRAVPLMWCAFGIAVLGLTAVLVSRGIIQTRYAMPAGLLIVALVAFVADAWWRRVRTRRERVTRRVVTALLVLYFVGEAGFDLLNSKRYYLDASDWIAHNTASDTRVFGNDLRVVYLADRRVDWRERYVLASGPPPNERFDYWAISVARRDEAPLKFADAQAAWRRVAEFANARGDAVVVYRTQSPADSTNLDPGAASTH